MIIKIFKNSQTLKNIMRSLGYYENVNYKNELNYVRPLNSSGYPRFHVYPREAGDFFELNLHLDAKKPSYRGTSAHSGEHDGDIVEREAERIKNFS